MPYIPGKLPALTNPDSIALAQYLEDELHSLASGLIENVTEVVLSPIFAAPKKPREGMVVYADGTLWNPGSGEGLYVYSSGGVWVWLEPASGVAWTAYTPVVTSQSGTLTTVSATGRWKSLGKTIFLEVNIFITTNGTGGGWVLASLPTPPSSSQYNIFVGREDALAGFMLQGRVASGGATNLEIFKSDGSYPGGSGFRLILSGVYEAA